MTLTLDLKTQHKTRRELKNTCKKLGQLQHTDVQQGRTFKFHSYEALLIQVKGSRCMSQTIR